jgi:hypothetical protein
VKRTDSHSIRTRLRDLAEVAGFLSLPDDFDQQMKP